MAARRGRARREPPGERAGPKRAAKTMDFPPAQGGQKAQNALGNRLLFGPHCGILVVR